MSPLPKTALRVRFCPTHPPWGLPPPGQAGSPRWFVFKDKGFQLCAFDQAQADHNRER